MDSKENIEAQLCAYIEGELTDAERAEIERHLDANPRHRALIADLQRQRMDLASLPRAKAPAELNEALCGQLERSALLNPSQAEDGDVVLRINRWPQFAAVAAVVLLAVGLGIVVYSVLPGAGGRNTVAVNDGSTSKNGETDRDAFYKDYRQYVGADKKLAQDEALRKTTLGDESRKQMDRQKESQEQLANQSRELAKGIEQKNKAGELAFGKPGPDFDDATGKDVMALRNNLDLRSRGIASSYVMYVSAEDVNGASEQVAALLKQKGIVYREEAVKSLAENAVALDLPRPDADRRASADKLEKGENGAVTSVTGGMGAGGGRGGAMPTAPAKDYDRAGVKSETESIARNSNPVENSPKGGASGETIAAKPNTAMQRSMKAPTMPPGNAGPGDTSNVEEKQALKAKSGKLDESLTRNDASREQERFSKFGAEAKKSDTADEKRTTEGTALPGPALGTVLTPGQMQAQSRTSGVIVATMNRRQAQELTQALSQGRQRAELKETAPITTVVTAPLHDANDKAVLDPAAKPLDDLKSQQPAPTTAGGFAANNQTYFAATNPTAGKDAVAPSTRPAHMLKTAAVPTTQPFGTVELKPTATADQPVGQAGGITPTAESSLHLNVDLLDQPIEVMIVVQQPVPADNVSQPANPAPTIDAGAKKDSEK